MPAAYVERIRGEYRNPETLVYVIDLIFSVTRSFRFGFSSSSTLERRIKIVYNAALALAAPRVIPVKLSGLVRHFE
jgi:hypothetical protein